MQKKGENLIFLAPCCQQPNSMSLLLSCFAALSLHPYVHVSALVPAEVPVTRRDFFSQPQGVMPGAAAGAISVAALQGWSPFQHLIPAANAVEGATDPLASISINRIDFPDPQFISTVIVDSQSTSAGLELDDLKVAGRSIVYVKSVVPDGVASKQGIEKGMVLLKYPDASVAKKRIKSGPYPIVLQFYNLSEGTLSSTDDGRTASAQEALESAQAQKAVATPTESDLYGSRGAGLSTQTIRKPAAGTCTAKSQKGDVLEVKFEARIGGRGGIIYDSSEESGNGLYKLGKGEVIAGVDLGTVDMCVGEVREIDIPSTLGYGAKGNPLYLIPPGSRLFWRVELISLQ